MLKTVPKPPYHEKEIFFVSTCINTYIRTYPGGEGELHLSAVGPEKEKKEKKAYNGNSCPWVNHPEFMRVSVSKKSVIGVDDKYDHASDAHANVG